MDNPEIRQSDFIPECRAAIWAWRVALIPILGLFLYMLFSFIALYRIGSKGMTGFYWLRKGFWRMLRITPVCAFCICIAWIYPRPYFGHITAFNIDRAYISEKSDLGNLRVGYYCIDTRLSDLPGFVLSEVRPDGRTTSSRGLSYPPKQILTGTWESDYFLAYHRKQDHSFYANIKIKGQFWLNNKDGNWTTYYANGKTKMIMGYKNDQPHGKWTFWDENGNKKAEGEFVEGKYSGAFTSFHDSGEKWVEGTWLDGRKIGRWIERDSDGKTIIDGEYSGNRFNTYILDRPNKIYAGYENGIKEGKHIEWDEHGHKIMEKEYKKGLLNGKSTTWNCEGVLRHVGYYTSNNIDKIELYDNKGSLVDIVDEQGQSIKTK